MARDKKPGSLKVPLAGMGGFILGAATVLLVVYLYGQLSGRPQVPRTISPPPPMAAPTPSSIVPPARETAPPPIPGAETTATPAPEAPATETSPALPAVPPPAELAARELMVPVQGVTRQALQDTFKDSRSQGRVHDAIDILAPRNTPVLAVEGGRIVKLFTSNKGGLTVYQFDPTNTYSYYYAHLERYAPGLAEGNQVTKGQVIGYVGTSGNAPPRSPHLHFAITRMTAEKRWWKGTPVDPFPVLHHLE
ncbi:MAG TPA: M23 family metallopeptidase, partial [Thermoanaerobaculia bacterium]|nr:M23 family metallopeptidase [Thermoanaerobaculia bacterium]